MSKDSYKQSLTINKFSAGAKATRKLACTLLIFLIFTAQISTNQGQSRYKNQENSVNNDQLKAELAVLKSETMQKVDHDIKDVADAFTNAEGIMRLLKVAYTFKVPLDAIATALTVITSTKDLKTTFRTQVVSTKSVLAENSLIMAVNTAIDTGNDIHFAFDGGKYVDSVDRMIKSAQSHQPSGAFSVLDAIGLTTTLDSNLYREDIENWLVGSQGEDIIRIAHKTPGLECQSSQSKVSAASIIRTIGGIQKLKLQLQEKFRQIETDLMSRDLSDAEMNQLLSHLRHVKTTIIKSKSQNASVNYNALRPGLNGQCEERDIQLELGTIAAKQQLLRWAYGAYNQDLALEQVAVMTTTVDSIFNILTIYTGVNSPPLAEKWSIESTGLGLAQFTERKIFPSTAREQIVEIPQEMLLSLSGEMSNLLVLLDDLKSINLKSVLVIEPPTASSPQIPTLFLFDVSGSMSDNDKIGQARAAGLDALREMKEAGSAPVSIMTFSGDQCGGNVTRKLLGYTTNLTEAENVMRLRLPIPNGGTPIPQARDAASADILGFLNSDPGLKEGRIILLSDGQSTCGAIRPPGVFSRRMDYNVNKSTASRVQYFTIGFDVEAGSAAERDLQFLASETGGKYYNAADRAGLISALKKQVRRYLPRACNSTSADVAAGLRAFGDRDFLQAAEALKRYVAANTGDPCGLYDLALANEASDRYKAAAANYQLYLGLSRNAAERSKIQAKIAEMNEEYTKQLDYFVRLIDSDRGYLKGFYNSVFNRKSSDLAGEYDGFMFEKGAFYANLPEILEINDRWLANDAKDISSSLKVLARRRGMASFDRDAVSLLTTPIGQIEDMLERLRAFQKNGN